MKIKSNKNAGKFLFFTAVALALLSVADPSFAASTSTMKDVAQNITNETSYYAKALLAIAFVAGLALAMTTIFKLYERSKNPQQTKLSSILVMAAASALLIGIPTFITLTTNTLLGTSHDSSDTTGSNYNRIK